MELEDLKKNWQSLVKEKEECTGISREQLETMIHSKGTSQFETIEKNIRIAYILLGLFWIIELGLDYFLSSLLNLKLPIWLSFVDYGLALVCSIFLIDFVYKVNKIDWHNLQTSNVASSIEKFLYVLKKFKRNYFFGISCLLISGAVGTIYSMYEEITNHYMRDVNNSNNLFLIIYILMSIVIFVSIFYFVYRIYIWLFNLLFGKHMVRLEELYEELNSITE
ncbi:hypothetical protein K4L44_00030 [Halosquirtibacter laminarini]|uniref:Uncharacterized protein n=1 Tax=Halosquirtibacter laminarini TaxID=3374600 RepID=A0AC61NNH9_9BACT|nr:hypothetical protein K4L44_00030 [Prolixibacteraceae bacterium]